MRTFTSLAAIVPLLAACQASPTDPGPDTDKPAVVVAIAPSVAALDLGASLRLTASVEGSAHQGATPSDIVWETSNPAIATVGTGGVVQALKLGQVQIVARWRGSAGVARVTVREPVEVPPCVDALIAGAARAPQGARPCP
jgi:hypothetical protein